MLGRKTFTQEELDSARKAIAAQLRAYRKLAEAAEGGPAGEALGKLEPLLFNEMALALDRRFVHRLRGTTGKGGTPLNELELIAESLMNNGGVLRGINVINYVPEESVLQLELGDRIAITRSGFERLAKAVLAEIESKFV